MALTFVLAIFLLVFIIAPDFLWSANRYAINLIASTVVLLQGVWVLRAIWRLERRRAPGAVPFCWCFLAVQHMAFGFGGFLVSLFDRDYSYVNEHGIFSFRDSVLPLLFGHAVALNAGLLGVWLALGLTTSRRRVRENLHPIFRHRWRDHRIVCYVTLCAHGLIWIFLLHAGLPGPLLYPVQIFAPLANAAYFLWGMFWSDCRRRSIFIAYTSCFVLLELILGSRGDAFFPLILFGIGYLVTGGSLSLRSALRWAPLVIFVAWGCIESENLRRQFTRGTVENGADATARVEALAAGTSDESAVDALGESLNAPFRIGSRLFELSAADVMTRTPDSVPFWGWSREDTSVLLTGFLPLKINSDAAFNGSDTAGVLWLQSYGWIYVDPSLGNSMPATLVGDCWRRFSWIGIVAFFVFWSWVMGQFTRYFRFPAHRTGLMIFSAATAASYITQYDSDVTSLISGTPRRLVMIAAYAAGIWALSKMFGAREVKASEGVPILTGLSASWSESIPGSGA